MPVKNIIKLSNLEGSRRIDAEYYKPIYWQLENFKKMRTKNLGSISSVSYGTTPAGAEFFNEGIPFIRSQDFPFLFVEEGNLVFCSREFHLKNTKSKVIPKDILFAAVGGTIGKVGIVQDWLEQGNVNQNVARVRITDKNILPEFALIFFLSKFGQLQIFRLITGNAQPYLNSYQIKSFSIPLLSLSFQEEIKKIYNKISIIIKCSREFYIQAEQLLLSELGLQDWKPARALTFVRSYSQVAKAGRMDAEYYHPKYDELRERIRQYPNGFLRITDIAANSDETVEPTAHAEDDYRYIELADINQVIGTIESANEIKGKDAPSRARMLLRAGDVIASTVEGSLDKVALVSEEYHGAIGSTGFFVLRPRTVQSGYLLALVKSIIVREQMRCEASGTILAAVPAKSLRNIIVPNIPPEKRDEIAQLVEQSHAARREAKALLEKAKRAVEIAIEEGEDAAIEFIEKKEAA